MYERAIALYERSFAAETYDRIIDLLENKWGFTEETDLQQARKERERLLAAGRSD